ncbi:MAG: hypothetical protein JWM12_3447 [Ilumatobacteraceae bacterium]|nr:hypothetical protein [Ilumatobacteraceae bacterium]
MEYLLFIANDQEPGDPAEAAGEVERWVDEGARRGIRIRGNALRPIDEATMVRVRDGQVLVTDGPYTESKEWIVGYDILECDDLDQAIDYVSRHPMARRGRIEIRPVATLSG